MNLFHTHALLLSRIGVTLMLFSCWCHLAEAQQKSTVKSATTKAVVEKTPMVSLETNPVPAETGRTITADVWAIDQPYFYNRLGAQQPTGTVFVLARDVVTIDGKTDRTPGNVKLRDSKRPRPIVIRINKGDTLVINFTNMLTPFDPKQNFNLNYVDRDTVVAAKDVNDSLLINKKVMSRTRSVGFHPAGLELIGSINSDASWVGANDNSLASPGGVTPGSSKTYKFYGAAEGSFLITPGSDNMGNGGLGNDQLSTGLFGVVVVEPEGAEYYRSQVTNEDLGLATKEWRDANGKLATPTTGLPIVNWNATYSANFWDNGRRGIPILNMLKSTGQSGHYELVCTDLTAVITGPGHGNFKYQYGTPDPDYLNVPASPDRYQPFREFVIVYHESPWTVQAFPTFYNPNMTGTVASGDDAFSINYGSGGIGAEIYANRIGVGPMADCLDCAYEEFFLSSWAVGDPATIVDVPANTATRNKVPKSDPANPIIKRTDVSQNVMATLVNQLELDLGTSRDTSLKELPNTYKATKALYPDDPSNVYHSYLRDHVKFRVLHGGGAVTHVHHQHAHQWLHSPNSDDGHYLDSQILNPGESYTLEMVYNGSGNRNQTVGDQIFHCHFYPHFAGGMWAMWRVHDVFEAGTKYASVQNLQMASGARALPDAEITSGTPIPALVPIPTIAMAPVPGVVSLDKSGQVVVKDTTLNPGYPFFIPGVAGSRPPHPPLDFAVDTVKGVPNILDGGLPRHVIVDGKLKWENHSKFDWTKIMAEAVAVQLPETGTQIEKVAMKAHAIRTRTSITPEGKKGSFIYNGLPPAPGAPYADPAIDDSGNAVGKKRIYKGANIQMDVVFNKDGWHYPQQRFITLWGDVDATLKGIRPPEPFFFRANTDEYVEYWHTNLVPEYYELDDYQVRTPTDILGQHIHLVKFDVTSSDGAANGFNYEDGTFSPETVQERIAAINKAIKRGRGYYLYAPGKGGAINNLNNYQKVPVSDTLKAKAPNPIWGDPKDHPEWYGAQTTIQRWYADPQLNNDGQERTVRTVFTHDHFGPSTHQQAGLYAGLLVEPQGSSWIDPMTGEVMGQTLANRQPKPRSVMVDGKTMQVTDGGPTGYQANIIMPNKDESYREFALEFQDISLAYTAQSKTQVDPYPVIPDNAFVNTTFQTAVANYTGWKDFANSIRGRNNGYSQLVVGSGNQGVFTMNYRSEPLPLRVTDASGNTATGQPGDLSFAFQSRTDRANPKFNSQPVGGSNINGPGSATFPKNPIAAGMGPGDPYTPLLRAYQGDKIQIRTLVGAHMLPHFYSMHGAKWYFEPSNKNSGFRATQSMGISEHFEMLFQLPTTGDSESDYLYMPSADQNGLQWGTWGLMRAYDPAKNPQQQLAPLPYNNPTGKLLPTVQTAGCPTGAPVKRDTIAAVMSAIALKNISDGNLVYNARDQVYDSLGLLLVRKRDLNQDGTLKTGIPVEPIVLRYNAGDCIQLTLENQFNTKINGTFGSNGGSSLTAGPVTYNWNTSSYIGLNADLLSYDVENNDGFTVGTNPVQTVAPGGSARTYTWYAGHWERQPDGSATAIPVEFGSVVLSANDLLQQSTHGLEGAIIIEPAGAHWVEDINSRASATVYDANGKALFREFVLLYNDNVALSVTAGVTLANYGTESVQGRYQTGNNPWLIDLTQVFANSLTGEPETPIFAVQKGTPVRLHLPTPEGSGNGAVFELHGHVWQEEPYQANSTRLGYNIASEWKGTQGQVGALNSFDILVDKAGGAHGVPGDYLYRSLANQMTFLGFWGLMRVTDGADMPTVSTIHSVSASSWNVTGDNTVNFALSSASSKANVFASMVSIYPAGVTTGAPIAQTKVDPLTGDWSFQNLNLVRGNQYTLVSTNGKGVNYGTRTFTAVDYGEGVKVSAEEKAKVKANLFLQAPPADPREERFLNLTKETARRKN